jgi:hypothetical protein
MLVLLLFVTYSTGLTLPVLLLGSGSSLPWLLLLLLLLLLLTCRYSSGLMAPVRKSVVSAPLLGASVVCSNLPGSAVSMGCACNTIGKEAGKVSWRKAVHN